MIAGGRATAALGFTRSAGTTRFAAIAVMASILSTAGCADAGADHMLLERFFAASRLLDRTELARFATVVFEPGRDGIVVQFTVVSASEFGEPASSTTVDDRRAQIIELSLADPTSLDATLPTRGATLTTRHVTVAARVRSPAGSVSPQMLDVTLQRAEAPQPARRPGRWIVTAVSLRRQAGSSFANFARSVFSPPVVNRTASFTSSSSGSTETTVPTPNV